MKIRNILAILIVFSFTAMVSGQSQCNKGHFIFGSDIVQYSAGASTYYETTGGKVEDSGKVTSTNLSYGIGIWAGYCVSNRVCVGIDYNFEQTPLAYYYPYYPYSFDYYQPFSLFPSNLFFRYYLVRADSGKFIDLALEGNLGVRANNSQNTFPDGYTGTNAGTITTQMDFFNLNSGIKLLLSFHISKHFALQLAGGFNTAYQSINFVSASETPPVQNFNFTPSKVTYFTYDFIGSFRLQFYL
jgi:hypothetical protein